MKNKRPVYVRLAPDAVFQAAENLVNRMNDFTIQSNANNEEQWNSNEYSGTIVTGKQYYPVFYILDEVYTHCEKDNLVFQSKNEEV